MTVFYKIYENHKETYANINYDVLLGARTKKWTVLGTRFTKVLLLVCKEPLKAKAKI